MGLDGIHLRVLSKLADILQTGQLHATAGFVSSCREPCHQTIILPRQPSEQNASRVRSSFSTGSDK